MYFLMTVDVEEHSLALNRLDDNTAKEVYKVGLPRLLDLLSKHDVLSTFYFTGTFAEKIPEAVQLVMDYGHEIGCHGYSHEVNRAFDVLSLEEQISELEKAKSAIEPIAGKITSFRAPAARINKFTVKALEETGFKTDSSVASQRFDGPMTFGAKNKLNWLFAPRNPYYLNYESPFIKGNSSILEIPISAYLFAFNGTNMRIAPKVNKFIGKILANETKKNGKPIVFVFHPVEVIEINGKVELTRRSKSYFGYLFGDIIRHQLKLKNLGENALKLVDEILKDMKQRGMEFLSINKFKEK